MANGKIVKGYCPRCQASQNSKIEGSYFEKQTSEDGFIWESVDYRILKCQGCEAVFFQQYILFSEDIDFRRDPITREEHMSLIPTVKHWPVEPKRTAPTWLDRIASNNQEICDMLEEVYIAFNNEAYVLATTGIRTTFDLISERLSIPGDDNFKKKLDNLETRQLIDPKQKDALSILTEAGNAAIHRGWKPDAPMINKLLDILETFLLNTLIVKEDALQLRPLIPPRRKNKS